MTGISLDAELVVRMVKPVWVLSSLCKWIERFTVPRIGLKSEMCRHTTSVVWIACSRIRGPEDNASVSGSSVGWARIVEAHPGTHSDLRSEATVLGAR